MFIYKVRLFLSEAESAVNIRSNNFHPITDEAAKRGHLFYLMNLFIFYITEHFHSHTDDMECELFLDLFHLFVLLHDLTVFIYFIFVPISFYNL
jgi:hypothetical protein